MKYRILSPHSTLLVFVVLLVVPFLALTAVNGAAARSLNPYAANANSTTKEKHARAPLVSDTLFLPMISKTTSSNLLSSICVSVYYDMNGNQAKDAGEPLLRGAGITIKNSSNVTVGSFVSYDTGARCLDNLAVDVYTVSEYVNAPSFASTTADTISVSLPAGSTANAYFGDSVSQPNGMVVDTARNHIFITSKNTGWLLAWDEVNNKTLMTVSVGNDPWGVGLLNDRVFVAEFGSKVVAVIDAVTYARITDINLAPICLGDPSHVAVNPATNKVYVAVRGSPSHIAVIDAVTLSVQCVALPTAEGNGAIGVAVNPILNQLYVTSREGQSMLVYDLSTGSGLGTLVQTVPLGGRSYFVQAKPSANRVYLTVGFNPPNYNTVTTLQAYTTTVSGVNLAATTTISNTNDGGEIWVSQKNGNLYVAETQDDRLQILNPTTLSILQNITMSTPFAIAENPTLGRMYISNRNVNLITTVSDNLP